MRTLLLTLLILNCSLAKATNVPRDSFKVIATVMTSVSGGYKLANGELNDANKRVFVALPCRSALGRTVTVYCPETGKTVSNVPVCDVGPHSTKDAYWERKDKPLAERGKSDKYKIAKNKAGIDMSLRLCKTLSLVYPYKGEIIWWFEDKQA